jgi:hypothetical protein
MDEGRQSLGELFGELADELGTLVRQELHLARTEMKEEATRAATAAGMLGGGAVTAWITLLFLSLALAWGLAEFMPAWVAFLIVGAIHGAATAALYARGRQKLQRVNPKPDDTIETLKEDKQWAKRQLA